MKIADLLTSPPPATGWSLDDRLAAVVRRQAKGALRCAAMDVPGGVFEIGPVGLQAVDRDALQPLLERLQHEVDGSKQAAVVLPSGWLRPYLLEFETLPRRRQDVHEMVVWRLKKLLPVPPTSLRLATVSLRRKDASAQLLVLVGVERAIADLEDAFRSLEITPRIITSRVFAVSGGANGEQPLLVVQQEAGVLSLMLLVDDEPRVIRTKLMAGADWAAVERELGLTLGFVSAKLGITEDIVVAASFEDEQLARRLGDWVTTTTGVTAASAQPPSFIFEGTSVRDRVRPCRLDPVVNLLSGGVR